MSKILSFLLFSVILAGIVAVGATDTALTTTRVLTGENSYVTEAYWDAAPTSTSTKYIAMSSDYDYFVLINATSVGTKPLLTVRAGNNPPAFRSGIGNLNLSLTANRTLIAGPLESARFKNTTGYLKFSTVNVTTAYMAVLKVKR
jgi:hypothetical protein